MRKLLPVVLLLLPITLRAQFAIKDGNSAGVAEVNPNGSLEVVDGRSSRPTYIVSVGGQATTAAYILSIESSAATGFKLVQLCVGSSNATAAAAVTVTVARRTTASSGGTALTAEGTGATSVSKVDPSDGNFTGIARLGGTPGAAGPVLDQFGFSVGEIAAGTADTAGPPVFCKSYGGATGEKPPTVSPGAANGLSINVGAAGSGGLASGSISATIIQE